MSMSNRIVFLVTVLACGAGLNSAVAQQETSVGPGPAPTTRSLPDNSNTADKECVGTDGASVCWLQFTDGTRCVVASNAGGTDGSTALNCHFSTPMERLHRMPKD